MLACQLYTVILYIILHLYISLSLLTMFKCILPCKFSWSQVSELYKLQDRRSQISYISLYSYFLGRSSLLLGGNIYSSYFNCYGNLDHCKLPDVLDLITKVNVIDYHSSECDSHMFMQDLLPCIRSNSFPLHECLTEHVLG